MPGPAVNWEWMAAIAVGILLLWSAAGAAIHLLDRRLDRIVGPRGARDLRPRRARVSRRFEPSDGGDGREGGADGIPAVGRVRIGLEIWRARCHMSLARELRVGDRVWVRPADATRVVVLDRADRPGAAGDRGGPTWTTDTSC